MNLEKLLAARAADFDAAAATNKKQPTRPGPELPLRHLSEDTICTRHHERVRGAFAPGVRQLVVMDRVQGVKMTGVYNANYLH